MSSSIFSFEVFDRLRRTSPRRLGRAGLLVACGLLVLVVQHRILTGDRTAIATRPEVLFIGTSHQMDALEPRLLPVAVSELSLPGLDLVLAERVFSIRRERWRQVRRVFIEVDEFSLFGDAVGAQIDDLSRICGDLDLAAWDLLSADDGFLRRYQVMSSLWRGRGLPGWSPRRRLTTKNLFRDPPPPSTAPAVLESELALRRVEYARRVFFGGVESRHFERNRAALDRLVGRLRGEGREVVLISYPLSDVYRASRPGHWESMLQLAVERVRRHHPEVEYWDYRDDPRFRGEHFKNVDHLNRDGSALFSAVMAECLGGVCR